PEQEVTMALTALLLASEAYETLLHKKSAILFQLLGLGKTKRMRSYEKLMSCKIMMAKLYLAQKNNQLTSEFQREVSALFEQYAPLRKEEILQEIRSDFMYSFIQGLEDTVGGWQPYENKKEELYQLKTLYHTTDEEVVFQHLGKQQLAQERAKLFSCLQALEGTKPLSA